MDEPAPAPAATEPVPDPPVAVGSGSVTLGAVAARAASITGADHDLAQFDLAVGAERGVEGRFAIAVQRLGLDELEGAILAAVALREPLPDGVRNDGDGLANTLVKSVQARAFTTGADIFFAQGEYRPQSSSGRELLGHELTHVMQQRGAPTTGEMRVSDPGDAQEREAERTARGL